MFRSLWGRTARRFSILHPLARSSRTMHSAEDLLPLARAAEQAWFTTSMRAGQTRASRRGSAPPSRPAKIARWRAPCRWAAKRSSARQVGDVDHLPGLDARRRSRSQRHRPHGELRGGAIRFALQLAGAGVPASRLVVGAHLELAADDARAG